LLLLKGAGGKQKGDVLKTLHKKCAHFQSEHIGNAKKKQWGVASKGDENEASGLKEQGADNKHRTPHTYRSIYIGLEGRDKIA